MTKLSINPPSNPRRIAGPGGWSPVELKRVLEAERTGEPFLVWREPGGEQRLFTLAGCTQATIGRRSSNDLVLSDGEVSRVHAELELIDRDWTVVDLGLSLNGTYLNGQRVGGRRRLADGDVLQFGATVIGFRDPSRAPDAHGSERATVPGRERLEAAELSAMQRRILIGLCRPFKHGDQYASPASNREIAAEVSLGEQAVKAQLRALYGQFGLDGLPQGEKRIRLVELVLQRGIVSGSEL